MCGSSEAALIRVDKFRKYDYGPTHPMKMYRLELTFALIRHLGLTDGVKLIEPEPAEEEDVLTFHTPEYLEVLKSADLGLFFPSAYRYGLGPGDNPIFAGVYEGSMLACGASIAAAKCILNGASVALNIAGGLHHAMPNRASGFCYLNDPVVAINFLLKHVDRVAYVDIDAHHGDGVQFAFYRTSKVLTISTHEDGRFLFPGTGFVDEIGEGEGKGYSVNIPFLPFSGDDAFIMALDEVVVPLLKAYNPDVLVTQLGADTLHGDPITHWRLTTHGFCAAVERFKELRKPWVALGGGGYDVGNVCRAWTLAWATMIGANVGDEIPPKWGELAKRYGIKLASLRDERPSTSEKAIIEATRATCERIKKLVFPTHGL
ncbi:MAG: acetoin utilization protein AcuC [Armatimonadota bacterium]|nr:acetoin utilization protein AcuC [Armatimonadota bacterium]MCX7777938.1 acetoin utilization protein AcuC [Armatimonadota bacterium]MDW8025629.1 acetoin utilization protein AcuC [Armatimonadota bacterium]